MRIDELAEPHLWARPRRGSLAPVPGMMTGDMTGYQRPHPRRAGHRPTVPPSGRSPFRRPRLEPPKDDAGAAAPSIGGRQPKRSRVRDGACERSQAPYRPPRLFENRALRLADVPAWVARARRSRRLWGAILFDAGQIARDAALYLSLVGSLLFLLLATMVGS
jgi:hypothetical protein